MDIGNPKIICYEGQEAIFITLGEYCGDWQICDDYLLERINSEYPHLQLKQIKCPHYSINTKTKKMCLWFSEYSGPIPC